MPTADYHLDEPGSRRKESGARSREKEHVGLQKAWSARLKGEPHGTSWESLPEQGQAAWALGTNARAPLLRLPTCPRQEAGGWACAKPGPHHRPHPCSTATLRGPDSLHPDGRGRDLKTELRRQHGCHLPPATLLMKTHQQLERSFLRYFHSCPLTSFRSLLKGHLFSEAVPGDPN